MHLTPFFTAMKLPETVQPQKGTRLLPACS